MSFENKLNEFYIPMVNQTVKKHFPEYHERLKNKKKGDRIGTEVLTSDQVLDLYHRYKDGGDMKARDLLIYSQLALTCYYTREFHYQNNGTELAAEDLLGFANYILIKLIDDKYDPYAQKTDEDIKAGRINKLPSFIRNWLKHKLHAELKDFGLMVRLPHNRIIDITNYKEYYSIFTNKMGREPYNGESFYFTQGTDEYKLLFNFDKKKLYVYTINNNVEELCKNINIQHSTDLLSLNDVVNEEGDEMIDLLPDTNQEFDIKSKDIISESLKEVLGKLNARDKESIDYIFFKKIPIKNIPHYLTPNPNSSNELNKLSRTSHNQIDIYIKKDGIEQVLTYNVTANFHVKNTENNPIRSNTFTPLSHCYKNITTNLKKAFFKIEVEDAQDIRIIHTTHKGTKTVKFKYKENIISFNLLYSYGQIFTSQTFSNKRKELIQKLRLKMGKLKNKYYE